MVVVVLLRVKNVRQIQRKLFPVQNQQGMGTVFLDGQRHQLLVAQPINQVLLIPCLPPTRRYMRYGMQILIP